LRSLRELADGSLLDRATTPVETVAAVPAQISSPISGIVVTGLAIVVLLCAGWPRPWSA
jgi:hypothetical protein